METLPTAKDIASLYPPSYSAHQAALQERDWSLLGVLPERGQVIEIGCGAGNALVSFAKAHPGWNITGVDFSEQGIGIARQALPQGTFITADIPTWLAQAPGGQANVVICEHVIEHVLDPSVLFHELIRLLAPGGMLLLSVPNAGSWTMQIFRSDAHHLEAPRHLLIPSHHSIQALCAREGVRMMRQEAQTYPSVFFKSLETKMPKVATVYRRLRLPSIMRAISEPLRHHITRTASKMTYVITR